MSKPQVRLPIRLLLPPVSPPPRVAFLEFSNIMNPLKRHLAITPITTATFKMTQPTVASEVNPVAKQPFKMAEIGANIRQQLKIPSTVTGIPPVDPKANPWPNAKP